jgi:hypothetical protein
VCRVWFFEDFLLELTSSAATRSTIVDALTHLVGMSTSSLGFVLRRHAELLNDFVCCHMRHATCLCSVDRPKLAEVTLNDKKFGFNLLAAVLS